MPFSAMHGIACQQWWKEVCVMEERLRFVARRLEGEGMSDLCREFGISRKTGYKIFNGYKDHGLEALCDRSRRPVQQNQADKNVIGWTTDTTDTF
jgi:transposase